MSIEDALADLVVNLVKNLQRAELHFGTLGSVLLEQTDGGGCRLTIDVKGEFVQPMMALAQEITKRAREAVKDSNMPAEGPGPDASGEQTPLGGD